MSSLATLARRGVEFAHETLTNNPNNDGDGEVEIQLPPGAAALVAITFLVFSVLLFAIHYTYGNVVGTLTIIEDPQTEAYVPVNQIPSDEEEAGTTKPPAYSAVEPDIQLVRTKPITSSLRSTIHHLQSRTGTYWSRFRGFSLFVCWTIVRSLLTMALGGLPFLRNFIGMGVAQILAEVILARWELTWYHIVMSEPSSKTWWQRVPSFRSSWTKIAPAVALRSVAQRIASVLPLVLCSSFGPMRRLQDPTFEPGMKDINGAFGQSLMVVFFTVSLFVLLEIPAIVTVVRVAASMLPEEDETIVPFDRSFGGKVTPSIIGGAGKIGMLEAWRSFAWSSRIRLLKLAFKVCAIILAVMILFIGVLIVEANFVLGDQIPIFLNAMNRKTNNGH